MTKYQTIICLTTIIMSSLIISCLYLGIISYLKTKIKDLIIFIGITIVNVLGCICTEAVVGYLIARYMF